MSSGNNSNKSSEGSLDIGDYHERILRYLVADFHQKGFKHVGVMPGGFSECHDLDSGSCYHCDRAATNKKGESSGKNYN